MSNLRIPWVEKYRPVDLENIIIQPALKKTIQDIMKKGAEDLPNLLFEGSAGTGKTTLARIIAEKMGFTYLYINASDESGIDTVRTKIKSFCTSMSLDGSLKLVILDEADGLSTAAQGNFRNLIEAVHKGSRFIFTCNYPEKISDPLKSRLKEVYFSPVDEKLILKRIGEILKAEAVAVPKEQMPKLVQLLRKHYPDIRKIINHLQYFSTSGILEIDFDELKTEDMFENYIKMVKGKKLSDIRELLRNNRLDYEGLIKKTFNAILDGKDESFRPITENQKAGIILLCAEYIHRSLNFVIDKEINFADFSVQLMNILGQGDK